MHSYVRALPLLSLLLAPGTLVADPPPDARDFLAGHGCPEIACDTERGAALWSFVQSFYAGRGHGLAWFRDAELTDAGRTVLRLLGEAENDGFDPRRYDPRRLGAPSPVLAVAGASVTLAEPDPRVVVDVGLTYAILRYASDVADGQVSPRDRGTFWTPGESPADPGPVLEAALAGHAERVLERARPWFPQYLALARTLRRYRVMAAAGGWSSLDVKPGRRSGAPVPGLRERLALSGDPSLQHFQARHGLPSTGRLDPATLAALNVPVEERIRQIELNLERWRWRARPGAPRHVLVNIPTFELHAYEDGGEALRMRVITGQGDSPTPVLSREITHVVFSPSWTVPPNMVATEVLPAVMRDLSYLRRRGLQVVRGDRVVDPARVNWRRAGDVQFRQPPGARNSLGGVKFVFANPFNVYLHDTPEDWLFARTRRTFSHGCVRLEKPEALARWVLRGDAEGWTERRIRAAMWRGREQHVPLPEPIPVSIAYFTTWVDDDGTIHFRPDVYRHDAAQTDLLPPPLAPSGTVLAFREAGN